MFSVFFLKSYRPPRELTWMSGMALLGLALAFGFSGYLLPWNELAYFATKIGTDMAGIVPLVGDCCLRVMRGGPDVTGATLSRFFGLHVTILPIDLRAVPRPSPVPDPAPGDEPAAFLGTCDSRARTRFMPFFPNFMMRELMFWMLALVVINALAVFFPWELGVKADPFAPAPAGIKPEWYFLSMLPVAQIFPGAFRTGRGRDGGADGVQPGRAGLVHAAALGPLVRHRQPRARLITALASVLAFLLVMTILGYLLA